MKSLSGRISSPGGFSRRQTSAACQPPQPGKATPPTVMDQYGGGIAQAQVIRACRSDGRLLANHLGGGGKHREVTVGLAGRGRVVRGVNVEDIDGVQPARAVA
jgi:hypothetical protein